MPRPLPSTTPPRLVELLHARQIPDLTALAERSGLQPRAAWELAARAKLRPLSIYRSLSKALGVSLDDMYQILTADGAVRRGKLEALMSERQIMSQSHLARICKVHPSTISDILSGKNSFGPLKTYKALSDGLSVNLDEFADIF